MAGAFYMPLKIIRQDITKIECDAIVNPSNRYLYPGGGTDLSIHEAAGPELLKACEALGGCEVGKAKITPGFNLPCKYVIHTAGTNWHKLENPKEMLVSCYTECLNLAKENGCESVAFPLIASGAYGFPKEDVLKTATRVISDFLFDNEMLIYLVVYDKTAFRISEKIFCDIKSYIDDNYVEARTGREFAKVSSDKHCRNLFSRFNLSGCREDLLPEHDTFEKTLSLDDVYEAESVSYEMMPCASMPAPSLDDMLKNMDKGFAETLFSYIDKNGLTDVECYKRSNVDKKTFSKIKCNKDYKPSKITAISFAIGLKLNPEETSHLLSTVGYCLSNSNMFDVIIQYFISTGNYDSIFDVNEVLYQFDQNMLGV